MWLAFALILSAYRVTKPCFPTGTKSLDLICVEGKAAFEVLPASIRKLVSWAGWKEGEITWLRLPYRVALMHTHEQIRARRRLSRIVFEPA